MRELSDAEIVHKSFNPDNLFVQGGESKPMSIKESMEGNWLCVFCRKEYAGKPKECPHCKKKLPSIPDALHIV